MPHSTPIAESSASGGTTTAMTVTTWLSRPVLGRTVAIGSGVSKPPSRLAHLRPVRPGCATQREVEDSGHGDGQHPPGGGSRSRDSGGQRDSGDNPGRCAPVVTHDELPPEPAERDEWPHVETATVGAGERLRSRA